MTRIGPRSCWCCGTEYYPRGHCVQGPRCRCGFQSPCRRCLKCPLHCTCPPAQPRYFLDTDGDSHWFLVDASRRSEWEAWSNLSPDDDRAWSHPNFAVPLGGGPNQVEFTAPTMDGEPLASTRPPAGVPHPMTPHTFSPEHLYHCQCGACRGYWSLSDRRPYVAVCPWCGAWAVLVLRPVEREAEPTGAKEAKK